MPDKFDPYREALVMEQTTIWPEECADWDLGRKQQLAGQLHAEPQAAGHLEYVRTHSGFCRKIVVTAADLQRVGG